MISASIALAFAAGMVATFNPCGFSLLPAYIGAFVAGDETEDRVDRRVVRAVGTAASVSVGFVLVFAGAGIVIDRIVGEARRQLPWVTIIIGAVLLIGGVAAAAGWKPSLGTWAPDFTRPGNRFLAMVAYGATYAIASLSCTIGPFLAVTGTAITQSASQVLATYIAYALGMGIIILTISVTAALAHTAINKHMSQVSRIAPRLGGVLMVLAGGYAIWYGRWELSVYDGDLTTDPVIDAIDSFRLGFVNLVESFGPGRLGALIVVVIAAIVIFARTVSPSRPQGGDGADPATTPQTVVDGGKPDGRATPVIQAGGRGTT